MTQYLIRCKAAVSGGCFREYPSCRCLNYYSDAGSHVLPLQNFRGRLTCGEKSELRTEASSPHLRWCYRGKFPFRPLARVTKGIAATRRSKGRERNINNRQGWRIWNSTYLAYFHDSIRILRSGAMLVVAFPWIRRIYAEELSQ